MLAVEDQGDASDEGGIEEGHSDQEEHESFEDFLLSKENWPNIMKQTVCL